MVFFVNDGKNFNKQSEISSVHLVFIDKEVSYIGSLPPKTLFTLMITSQIKFAQYRKTLE